MRQVFVGWSIRGALSTALCLSATEVLAQPLSLAWEAPAGCPSQVAVLQGVERIVGRPLDELAVPWTWARGAVMRQQEGWLLQVIVVSADGAKHERLLAAASCAEAAEAASVVLATSLGAAQPTRTLAHTPAPSPSGSHPPAMSPSVAGTHVDSVFWSAGQGSAVLRWRRGSSGSLWLEAELVVPFRRLYVELASTELHRTPSASAQLWLGFGLDL